MTRKIFLSLFSLFTLSLLVISAHSAQAQLSSISTSPTPFSNAINPNNQNIIYGTAFDCRLADVIVLDDCAYVDVFDFSDKTHPILLYSTTTDATTAFIFAQGDYAYTGTYSGKLTTYDMSDPSQPIVTNVQQMPDSISIGGKMRMINGYMATVFNQSGFAGPGGVLFFDLSDPAIPALVARIDFPDNESGSGDIVQVGDYLYVADYFGYALRVYDISDTLNPVLVQTINGVTEPADYKVINGTGFFEPWGLAAKDNAVYLMDDNIIQVYDISSSTHMVYNKTIVAQKDVEGFAIKNNILYFSATFDHKLSYYDVTDALNPTLLVESSTPTANNNYWLSLDDNGYYYVSSTGNSILSVYEPFKVAKSSFVVDVVQDSQKTYGLRLVTAPSSNVTLTLATTTAAAEPCITISPTLLTFTPDNWDEQQTITVNSVSGGAGCSLGSTAFISTTASSADGYYNNALVSDVKVTIVAGFTSVQSFFWNSGATWGLPTGGGAGIEYPASSSSATINHTVALNTNTAANFLNINPGGILNFGSSVLSVVSGFINRGTINIGTSQVTFSGQRSYNEGTVNGSATANRVTFTNEGYNASGGTVQGNALFTSAGYNLGTVHGDSTFVDDVVDGTGVTTGNVIRKYTSNVATTRNFITENGRNDWIIIADGAVVNVASSTYATTTDKFRAINGGSFIYAGNPSGKVVPNVTITTPTTSATIIKWSPVINWDDSVTCEYSFDNFDTTIPTICASNGSDIAKPSSAGTTTLKVRGTNIHGSYAEKSVTFIYNNTAAIPTSCGSDLLDEPTRLFYYLTGNVTGDCRFTVDAELRGASTTSIVGYTVTGNIIATTTIEGRSIQLKNITITGTVTASGANDSGSTFGYSGGTITLATTTTGAITSNGGNGSSRGGNGGAVVATNSVGISSSTPISASGGSATVCGHGGNGGSVSLINSTYGSVSINPGLDQTTIGAGLCQAPPSGSSGSSGSQSIVGAYTPPPPNSNNANQNNQNQPPVGDAGPGVGAAAGGGSSGGSVIALGNNPLLSQQLGTSTSHQIPGTPTPSTIGASIREIVKGTTEVVNSPISKTVQTVGFFAGLVGAISLYTNALFATPLLASEVLLIPIRLWGLFLMGFGLRKRTPPWGTVYDSVTKQPIDPAFVTARDEHGKVVAESITDIDGRYGFLLPDGTYHLSVARTNYEFPSKKMIGTAADEMYKDLYFGEEVTVTGGQVIDKNIPLDRKNFDWNEEAKNTQDVMVFHKKNEKIFRKIGNYVFKIGSVISVVSVALNPSTYNIVILAVYACVAVLSHFGVKGKKLGIVRDRNTGKPFSYAIFRVTTLDHETVLRSGVCDAHGRYYCIVPKGEYYLEIEKKNANGSYTKVYQSDLISSKNGIINKDFAI